MHTMIVGTSKYGKTTLCKSMAQRLAAHGKRVAICDIFRPIGWGRGVIFVHPEKLVQFAETERNYFIFCDEASDYIGHEKTYQNIAKKAANYGHYLFIIAQRYKMVHPSTRTQCSDVIAFRLCTDDADDLARDKAQPGLRDAATLGKGEYLHYTGPDAPIARRRIF